MSDEHAGHAIRSWRARGFGDLVKRLNRIEAIELMLLLLDSHKAKMVTEGGEIEAKFDRLLRTQDGFTVRFTATAVPPEKGLASAMKLDILGEVTEHKFDGPVLAAGGDVAMDLRLSRISQSMADNCHGQPHWPEPEEIV